MELLQPRFFHRCRVDVIQVGVRRSTPQPEGLADQPHSPLRVTQPQRLLSETHEFLEPVGVDLSRSEHQGVPGGAGDHGLVQSRLGQSTAQMRDMAAEGHLGPLGRSLAPQTRRQPVRRDRPVAMQHEQGEQLARLAASQSQPTGPGPVDLDRSEDREQRAGRHRHLTSAP